MPTKEECKRILFKCGIELGVSPKLISERLLSDEDKVDMLSGKFDISSLRESVEVWRDNGMPDCAHGGTETYEAEKRRITYEKSLNENSEDKGQAYRKPFVDYRVVD